MNPQWKNFLLSGQAVIENDGRIVFAESQSGQHHIYPISDLGILVVSGMDAAKLLQGQATCNVFEVTENQARIGAFCNPKGRAIATFLLAKQGGDYLLVLPLELLEPVKTRLQKYVLRSDVKFTDRSDELCLIGISDAEAAAAPLFAADHEHNAVSITMGGAPARQLLIAEAEQAIALWSDRIAGQGYVPCGSEDWRYLDLIAGIPWLTQATSEEYIPQMLNLDKLGGISFTKGCYTGQEIVARTHYLGKTKREMFLAEADTAAVPEPNASVIDNNSEPETIVGKVLSAFGHRNKCMMLIVLQIPGSDSQDLRLSTPDRDKITLLPL
jgi:folate-binding protein YgfZ